MNSIIENDQEQTKLIANQIGDLATTKITKANGTSEVSNDGLTARFSDEILNHLDDNLKTYFELLLSNSNTRFNWIADNFKEADNLIISEE